MTNRFHSIPNEFKVNNKSFLMGLLIICLFYLLGEFPLAIAVGLSNVDASDNYVVIASELYGKTISFALLLAPLVSVALSFILISKIFNWPFQLFITSRESFDKKRYTFSFFLWTIICLLQFYIVKDENVIWNFKPQNFYPLIGVAIVTLFVQTLAEELVFRSFLLKWIGSAVKSPIVPALITGVLFGLMHGANPEIEALGSNAILIYIWSGVFLGILTVLDDGIEITGGYHFANNLFAALMVTNNWQVFTTDALYIDTNPPSFQYSDLLLVIGLDTLFFVMCYYIYKWDIKKLIRD